MVRYGKSDKKKSYPSSVDLILSVDFKFRKNSKMAPDMINQSSFPLSSAKENKINTISSNEIQDRKHEKGLNLLLDQFSDDDGLTSDLLHAIRSWNLGHPGDANELETTISTDIDTAASMSPTSTSPTSTSPTSMSRTSVSRTSASRTSASRKSTNDIAVASTPIRKATPCRGNYSSRASYLTSCIIAGHSTPSNTTQHDSNSPIALSYGHHSSMTTDSKQRSDGVYNGEGFSKSFPSEKIKFSSSSHKENDTLSSNAGDSVMETVNHEFQQNQLDSISTLQDITEILGLPKGDIHAVVPTLKKLVRIIMQHVPKMESFVDEVCQVVLPMTNDTCRKKGCVNQNQDNMTRIHVNTNPSVSPVQGHRKKRLKKRNIEARRKKMDSALCVLNERWPKGLKCRFPLKEASNKNRHNCQRENETSNENIAEADLVFASSASEFRETVIHKLSTRLVLKDEKEIFNPSRKISPELLLSTKISPPPLSDSDALRALEELIEMQQSLPSANTVSKQVVERSTVQLRNRDQEIGDSIINQADLDPSSNQIFVSHFMRVFSVQQRDIISKMNELYVFDREASLLVKVLKDSLCLGVSCPLSEVLRKIKEAISYDKIECDNNVSSQSNSPCRLLKC